MPLLQPCFTTTGLPGLRAAAVPKITWLCADNARLMRKSLILFVRVHRAVKSARLRWFLVATRIACK